MTTKSSIRTALIPLFIAVVFFAGCAKRVATVPAPPAAAPPAPATPTVTLKATPGDITKGESATLTWSSTDANQLTLSPGLGNVNVQGSQQVVPDDSTTYTITATGNGGTAQASARVTVSAPPVASQPSEGMDEMFREAVKDAFFDYDKSDIRPDSKQSLTKNAEFLNLHSQIRFTIEGHCDERGSEEYNIGLGDRRATAAKNYMVSLGISEDRIQTTSYGKERPFCTEHNEACYQQNRRAHFVMAR